jgi:hypothetical protein
MLRNRRRVDGVTVRTVNTLSLRTGLGSSSDSQPQALRRSRHDDQLLVLPPPLPQVPDPLYEPGGDVAAYYLYGGVNEVLALA